MYIMLGIRPDVAFSITVLSRNIEHSIPEDISKLKNKTKDDNLECYSDVHFRGCNR